MNKNDYRVYVGDCDFGTIAANSEQEARDLAATMAGYASESDMERRLEQASGFVVEPIDQPTPGTVDALRGMAPEGQATIYRVTTKETGSVQPQGGGTFWRRDVLYCGTDRTAARVAYHESEPRDYGGTYGNPARVTEFEALNQSDPNLDDTEAGIMETAEP